MQEHIVDIKLVIVPILVHMIYISSMYVVLIMALNPTFDDFLSEILPFTKIWYVLQRIIF